MHIKKIDLTRFKNSGYLEFQSEVQDFVMRFGAGNLKIEALFATYMLIFVQMKEAFHVIIKSAITEDMREADIKRYLVFRGLVDAVKSARNHFNPNTREASRRFKIAIDQQGNVLRKPYDEKTAILSGLAIQARTMFPTEINTLGMTDWIDELDLRNSAYNDLEVKRNAEFAKVTELRMKPVRVEMDAAYRALTNRMNALLLLNEDETAEEFARLLNTRIDHYKLIQAQKKGRAAKKRKNGKDDSPLSFPPLLFPSDKADGNENGPN